MEWLTGRPRYLVAYLASGLTGSATSFACNSTASAGASGDLQHHVIVSSNAMLLAVGEHLS